MLVSVSWLKKYVRIPVDAKTLAADLTMTGLNVERVESRGVSLEHVVAGRVLEKARHPNADRLSCCRVEVGPNDVRDIVCGAPNVAAGQLVLVALPGAQLPNGMAIKRSKIRGIVSDGMICSEIELGIGEDASGIIALAGDHAPGTPVAAVFGGSDEVLEIEVTANRGDLLCHLGVAREAAAIYKTPLELPVDLRREPAAGGKPDFEIEIEDKNDCARYFGRRVSGVRVGPSPEWLVKSLEAVGLQSVNNVVDVSNYVMMELGQPLHAFDYRRLDGGVIKVRRARPGEKLLALDGKSYELGRSVLVIADKDRPVALAGIMGGEESAVHPETTEILIESANFHPTVVRRGRKAVALSTDASYRFERGVDREMCRAAADRAAGLICEVAGGTVGPWVDNYPSPGERRIVTIRERNTQRILGAPVAAEEIAGLLERFGFEVRGKGEDAVNVVVPSHRPDVVEEIDLIEEVARLYGYDRIGTGWPFRCTTFAVVDGFDQFAESVADYLAGRGFTEIRATAFTDGRELEDFGWNSGDVRARPIPIRNPLNANQRYLRTSLLPGMLDTVRRNADYGAKRLRLFQTGPVFLAPEGPTKLPEEGTVLALVMSQPEGTDFWMNPKTTAGVFDIKAEVEALLRTMKMDPSSGLSYAFDAPTGEFSYSTKEGALVEGGVVSETVAERCGIEQPVWFATFDLSKCYELKGCQGRLKALPEYPASRRDLSLVARPGSGYGEIEKALVKNAGPLLESAMVFDVYRGDNIPRGYTAYGVRLSFRAPDRTLRDEEIDRIIDKVVTTLKNELGVELRS
jgi:phenylalanyl-tRNA synthetase beta chain